MDREFESLLNRSTALLAGIYGFAEGEDGQQIVRVGGSAIFVAPYQALTARHVHHDLFHTVPSYFDSLSRKSKGYFCLPHSSGMFQVVSRQNELRAVVWSITRTWDPVVTDICFMESALEPNEEFTKHLVMPTTFFDWVLEPPSIGEEVVMIGFPKTEIAVTGNHWNINFTCVAQKGCVIAVHEEKRDTGMYSFPCFAVDKPVDPGCSGGPVFWRDRLCGIVSGGSVDNSTYVASLWPLALMEYEYPDLGVLGGKVKFGDLLERGVIHADDWNMIKSRISKQYDEQGKPFVTIRKPT